MRGDMQRKYASLFPMELSDFSQIVPDLRRIHLWRPFLFLPKWFPTTNINPRAVILTPLLAGFVIWPLIPVNSAVRTAGNCFCPRGLSLFLQVSNTRLGVNSSAQLMKKAQRPLGYHIFRSALRIDGQTLHVFQILICQSLDINKQQKLMTKAISDMADNSA